MLTACDDPHPQRLPLPFRASIVETSAPWYAKSANPADTEIGETRAASSSIRASVKSVSSCSGLRESPSASPDRLPGLCLISKSYSDRMCAHLACIPVNFVCLLKKVSGALEHYLPAKSCFLAVALIPVSLQRCLRMGKFLAPCTVSALENANCCS
jgi:hypothetical protein